MEGSARHEGQNALRHELEPVRSRSMMGHKLVLSRSECVIDAQKLRGYGELLSFFVRRDTLPRSVGLAEREPETRKGRASKNIADGARHNQRVRSKTLYLSAASAKLERACRKRYFLSLREDPHQRPWGRQAFCGVAHPASTILRNLEIDAKCAYFGEEWQSLEVLLIHHGERFHIEETACHEEHDQRIPPARVVRYHEQRMSFGPSFHCRESVDPNLSERPPYALLGIAGKPRQKPRTRRSGYHKPCSIVVRATIVGDNS